MAEDVVSIEIEFDKQKTCKVVHGIFHNLRAALRGEAVQFTEEKILDQIGAINEKARKLLLTPLEITEETKAWLKEEIRPSKRDEFEMQWMLLPSEGAWINSESILYLFRPNDFPYKNRKIMRASWMWNRCYLITAALMIKMFKELGAVRTKSSVAYEDSSN